MPGRVGSQSSSSNSSTCSVSAAVGTTVMASATGAGSVTVGVYPANPKPGSLILWDSKYSTIFTDVAVERGSAFQSLTIESCSINGP